jgi:pyruvate formate lyase activating enzyme
VFISPLRRVPSGIKGFLETSFIDWPGKLAAVIFLAGCNFRCPFCHNGELTGRGGGIPDIPLDEILRRLEELGGWVEGVVVSGGEPTLHPRLPELLQVFRNAGLEVKLDTNGSRPAVLSSLIREGLLQAVDMDLKAPFDHASYSRLAGVETDPDAVLASMDLIVRSGLPHRFRTTFVPALLDAEAVGKIVSRVPPSSEYVLQAFDSRRVLDPSLAGRPSPTEEEMRELRERVEAFRLQESPEVRGFLGTAAGGRTGSHP